MLNWQRAVACCALTGAVMAITIGAGQLQPQKETLEDYQRMVNELNLEYGCDIEVLEIPEDQTVEELRAFLIPLIEHSNEAGEIQERETQAGRMTWVDAD